MLHQWATKRIPAGELGTRATIGQMRRQVHRGVRHPLTVSLAGLIVEGAGAYQPAQVAALRSWLETSVRFLRDPHGVELLREVPEMLDMIRARGLALLDCDDVAVLGAALGKAVGLPARFVVLGFWYPSAPFRHVFTELYDGKRWRELDITRPFQRIPPISRVSRFPV